MTHNARTDVSPKVPLQNKNICCGLYDQQTAGVHYQGTIIFDVGTEKIESLVGNVFCVIASSDFRLHISAISSEHSQCADWHK